MIKAYSPGVCLANLEGSLTAASPALRLTGIFQTLESIYQVTIPPDTLEKSKDKSSSKMC